MHTITKTRIATTKTKMANPMRPINMEAVATLVMATVPTVLLETMGTTRTMRTKTETTVVLAMAAISELPNRRSINIFTKKCSIY